MFEVSCGPFDSSEFFAEVSRRYFSVSQPYVDVSRPSGRFFNVSWLSVEVSWFHFRVSQTVDLSRGSINFLGPSFVISEVFWGFPQFQTNQTSGVLYKKIIFLVSFVIGYFKMPQISFKNK
jgi:hypothetical protein